MKMEIPRGLYQFEDEKALLITTGKQTGRLFTARNGRLKEIDEAFIPTPKYSDDEGFFERSGRGGSYGAGAVREPKDTETKHKFIRVISKKVKDAVAKNKIDCIYLFSPNYEITELKAALPRDVQALIRFAIMGNFVKFAPDILLEKITAKMAKIKDKNQILKPEEAKIMARPRETTNKMRRQVVKTRKS
jgi:hypothetical protein